MHVLILCERAHILHLAITESKHVLSTCVKINVKTVPFPDIILLVSVSAKVQMYMCMHVRAYTKIKNVI